MQQLTRRGQHRFQSWPRAAVLVVAVLAWASVGVHAQLPAAPAAPQFDITGFLQEATVTAGGDALSGGTLKVNGHAVIVPRNTIVILPATALTWQELFKLAPAPYTGVATGMAQADSPTPMTTYEVHVAGNQLPNGTYVAGLIDISQAALNSGAGYINFINYTTGDIFVGGSTPDGTTGARVQINDPLGKFSRVMTPDVRFTIDEDNPTIRSVTGFPMCLPREAPGTINADLTVGDQLCPELNRSIGGAVPNANGVAFMGSFFMAPPGAGFPNPTIQAPFEVGDYVTFAGNLVNTGATPTAGPWSGTANTYIAAHTIVNNVAIYTQPGTNPAYVAIDVSILGTGGDIILGAAEAAIRTRFEGFTTDPSRIIHVYGMDVTPAGVVSDRDWGTVGVDPGPGGGGGAMGRWRLRAANTCLGVPINGSAPFNICTPPPAGVYTPATREVRAVLEGQQTQDNPATALTSANGLIYGQYHAPIAEYIFPEQVPGAPVVSMNFDTFPFLAAGGYTSATGVVAGILSPWPGLVNPGPPAPTAPVVHIVGPLTVASGGTITLDASTSTGAAPLSFVWTAGVGTFGTPNAAVTTYTAPVGLTPTDTVTLTVTDSNAPALSSTASETITINPPLAPTVSYVPAAPVTVVSGNAVSITASCTDPNVPAATPCTFAWTQTNAGAPGVPTVLVPNPDPIATIAFTPILPIGQLTSAVIQLQVVATNLFGVASAPEFTNVTVNPQQDVVRITAAEYRTSKQRLIINASSSVTSPNLVLTLQPYITSTGVLFNPGAAGVFVNQTGGLYLLDIAGIPEPALPPAVPLTVTSSPLGGVSLPSGLTLIRR